MFGNLPGFELLNETKATCKDTDLVCYSLTLFKFKIVYLPMLRGEFKNFCEKK
jgi:hypothetical protein